MEEICASIMQAACEGRVSDVESLVLSNNIDVNACLFVREELELTSKTRDREFSRPSALGAVPERCAQPPTVPDSREYVNWVDLVWG